MGHIDGPDAMALAFMNSAGVRQMMGYTVPTWYGYGGWGCLDYFVEQPGRYTFVEAFFANQHALIDRLETNFPDLARLDTPRARGRQESSHSRMRPGTRGSPNKMALACCMTAMWWHCTAILRGTRSWHPESSRMSNR